KRALNTAFHSARIRGQAKDSMHHERPHNPADRDDDGRAWEDQLLPTICLVQVRHPAIPGLYQRCFQYVEPWQWSPSTELVETGMYLFAETKRGTGKRNG